MVYIVHAKTGYEIHEARLRKIFDRWDWTDYEFMTDGDVSNFGNFTLGDYFSADIRSTMSDGTLSCTLNHILCYRKIVERQEPYALVFENDPFFLGDFPKDIAKVIHAATKLEPGFLISLENTTLEFPRFRDRKPNQLLYPATHGRCAGAYLIDLAAAKNILAHLDTEKCAQVIDWWHNTLIAQQVIRMYWAHPALVEQGSHNGQMSSIISSKNKGIVRRFRWLAQKCYKMYVRPWF